MPLLGEVVHQAEEEEQVVDVDTFCVEGQDESAFPRRYAAGNSRVLRALGDAVVGKQASCGIVPQEGSQTSPSVTSV